MTTATLTIAPTPTATLTSAPTASADTRAESRETITSPKPLHTRESLSLRSKTALRDLASLANVAGRGKLDKAGLIDALVGKALPVPIATAIIASGVGTMAEIRLAVSTVRPDVKGASSMDKPRLIHLLVTGVKLAKVNAPGTVAWLRSLAGGDGVKIKGRSTMGVPALVVAMFKAGLGAEILSGVNVKGAGFFTPKSGKREVTRLDTVRALIVAGFHDDAILAMVPGFNPDDDAAKCDAALEAFGVKLG